MPSPTESETDLVIIGAGPAGLMAAAWAAKYRIATRFIDDKPDRVQTGHADSLTCRTMELLDSFGLADVVMRECCPDLQMRSWAPDPHGGIESVSTVNTQKPGVSRFQQCLIHQGRIEQLLQDMIEEEGLFRVERDVKTVKLRIDEQLARSSDPDAHPVTLKLQHKSPQASLTEQNSEETIRAKYVIGCDGAHSWTRRQLDVEMKGDTTNAIWGVLDIVPLTDFPNVRQTCVITSRSHGAIHLVPREGRLIRLYIQLAEIDVAAHERFDRSAVTPSMLLRTAQKILHPYKIDYKVCDWWSVYQVGQRVADQFSVHDRIFLAGDAIHTHSPKVGQGMNVSIGDTYNLAWKLCSVIKGIIRPLVLSTYQFERRSVALKLLDVDRATTAYYSDAPSTEPRKGLQAFRDELYDFLSGVAVEYADSCITNHGFETGSSNGSDRGGKMKIGQRMPSCLVSNIASARPTCISELLRSTGAWHILVFTGDLLVPDQMTRIRKLADRFTDPTSVLCAHIGTTIELFTIISGKRDDVPLLSLPGIFHPWDEELGWDYGKVFADEKSPNGVGGGDAYESLGIDKTNGCIVICRPDQHVGLICGIDEWQRLEEYFAGFLV